jgi:acyl carrier protein
MKIDLLALLNRIRNPKGLAPIESLEATMRLRDDLGLESLDLAELTVRIEDETSIDVFANSIPTTVGDIQTQLDK